MAPIQDIRVYIIYINFATGIISMSTLLSLNVNVFYFTPIQYISVSNIKYRMR